MNDEKLTNAIKQHLDKSAEYPSDDVAQSLAHIRKSALDKAEERSNLSQNLILAFWQHKAVSGFASIAALAVILMLFNQPYVNHSEINDLSAFELMMSEDNLEFYEDLEFYQWLLLEDQQSG